MTHAHEPAHADVAVVGAGRAGRAAARLLRRAGRTVVVVDGAEPGGRGRTDVRDGYHFNRGPRAVYRGGHAERVLTTLAVPLLGGPPSSDAAGLVGDRIGPLPAGATTLARTRLLSAKGKLGVARLLARFGSVDADALGAVTFRDWIDQHDLAPDAVQLVEMLGRLSTYANAPDEASADLVVGQMQMAIAHGVQYLHGGWGSLVTALAADQVVHRAAAASVVRDGTDVVVTCVDGSRVVATAVVVAVGAPDAAASLVGSAPFDAGPAVEAACLDLGTVVPARPALLIGIDAPLYLSNHCPPARLAPDGRHVVHVARYLSAGDRLDPTAQRAELERHAARVGLAGDRIETARYLHRMTVTGGLAIARTGGLRGRPGVGAAAIPGVFLAGDWVGARGHLLDAALASAEEAAMAADRAVSAATLVPR